jgi:hypothetical protein
VLAEAGELLDGHSEADSDSTGGSVSARIDLEAVLDQVEALVNDVTSETEPSGESGAFDLTAVADDAPKEPIDQVPDLGPEGPVADLFAEAPAEPRPSNETPLNPQIVFDSEDSIEDAVSMAMTREFGQEPPVLPSVEPVGDPFQAETSSPSPPDDAARRLERLLADRLAEEFDLVEGVGLQKTMVEDSSEMEPTPPDMITIRGGDDSASSAAPSEVSVMNEFAEDPTVEPMRSPVVTESNAVEQAARVEFIEPSMPFEPPPVADLVVEDSVGHPELTVEEPELDESTTIASEPAPESSPRPTEIPEVPEVPEVAQPLNEVEEEDTVDPDVRDEDRPRPENARSRTRPLLAAATIPYRILPKNVHRLVTPLAISLAAWVPITWGYTLLAPTPVPEPTNVLRAGFDAASRPDVPASTVDSVPPAESSEVGI